MLCQRTPPAQRACTSPPLHLPSRLRPHLVRHQRDYVPARGQEVGEREAAREQDVAVRVREQMAEAGRQHYCVSKGRGIRDGG